MTDIADNPQNGVPPTRSGRRRKAWLAVGGIALLVAASWQLGMWRSTPVEKRSDGVAASSAGDFATGLTVYRAGQRPPLPALSGPTLDGKQLDIQTLAGHVVVLNVWGSWCGPCRAEAPDLSKLARQTSNRGVRFVGIDTRDTVDAARAFMRHYQISYPSLVDKQGELLLNLNGVIPITAVPSTVVVDADGNIAAKVVGRIDYTTLKGIITDLLHETPIRETSGGGNS
jgi:thiol-disulfide isomerase/thioredoxin